MRESSLSKLAYALAFLSGIDNWLLIQSLVESCRDWTDEYFREKVVGVQKSENYCFFEHLPG